MSTITVYVSTVSSNMELKKQQQKIKMVLDGKKIDYEEADIATFPDLKTKMRELAGEGSMPPQIAKGDQYLGDYAAFDMAVEDEELMSFLKL